MSSLIERKRASGLVWLAALLLFVTASAAGAETLMMPNRDMQMGVSEVVWGITTLPNAGSTFSIDFGDGSAPTVFAPVSAGAVAPNGARDRSYINLVHTYALAGTFTATLTVDPAAGANETATVTIRVFDRPALTDVEKRGLDVNRAIENGLRYLWTIESGRTVFDTDPTAFWQNQSFTALVVLAFENHGYKLPNNDNPPTGLYEKYVVQRGLNQIFSGLTQVTLVAQPALNPCQGSGSDCQGLQDFTNSVGYSTAIAGLPISGSSALARHVTVGIAYLVGKTYSEVLQRVTNTVVFNQCDSLGASRGGWGYGANSCSSDSSVVGWDLLALFDAGAAGSVIPAAVKSEFGVAGGAGGNIHALEGHRNDTDGSFDYTANVSETANDGIGKNLAKTAIGLQALFFVGETTGARVDLTVAEVNKWFPAATPAGAAFACSNGTYNKGCGYGMFNAFKALKLMGISTLPNVGRPAGPGSIPANDWYADYVDWLIANQTSPTTSTGGNWVPLNFSSSGDGESGNSALAELILSPVALISPDPTLFGSVGLSQGNPLSQQPDTNPVDTDHTVTALVESATHTPIAGATVGFTVLTGPNAGAPGVCNPVGCVTGADGKVTFTYHGGTVVGSDTIRANIGTLNSNTLTKNWVLAVSRCDADSDGDVDQSDLTIIRSANGGVAGPTDPRDGNGDGRINVADVRFCQLRQTGGVQ